jgi:hypothetical protein
VERPGKSGENIKSMSVTYFDCDGAVHQYLFLKAEQLTRISTERFAMAEGESPLTTSKRTVEPGLVDSP